MMSPRCNMGGGDALLQKLRQVDFAIYDTVLYLDAYPKCRKALAHYHNLIEIKKRLTAEYEAQFGPITAFSVHSKTDWSWCETPWPWEMT